MHCAAYEGHDECLQSLIKAGADVNAKNVMFKERHEIWKLWSKEICEIRVRESQKLLGKCEEEVQFTVYFQYLSFLPSDGGMVLIFFLWMDF